MDESDTLIKGKWHCCDVHNLAGQKKIPVTISVVCKKKKPKMLFQQVPHQAEPTAKQAEQHGSMPSAIKPMVWGIEKNVKVQKI